MTSVIAADSLESFPLGVMAIATPECKVIKSRSALLARTRNIIGR